MIKDVQFGVGLTLIIVGVAIALSCPPWAIIVAGGIILTGTAL